ncbi:ABC transporter ATP-binding protein [Actibacterium sp. D379-3]
MGLALSVTDLTVTGDNGRRLLEVPALALPPGQSLGIRGPSGAGKSTLLFALAGLLDRVTGRTHWGETDLIALPADRRGAFRARHMGLIFQDFLLFEELSAIGNAALPALFQPRRRRAALRARAAAHLAHLGLTEPDRGVASFSGGERQRVAIARALANDADILLADEPTASLHREAADRLIEDMTATTRAEGKTLIAVSHDMGLLNRMDRVLTITDGRISDDSGAG